jgi:hypothetical protein
LVYYFHFHLFSRISTESACSETRNANPIKHSKLQTIFKGNYTAMCTHIKRMGMSHYQQYREKCLQQDIEMDEQCAPQEELDRLDGKGINK